MIGLAFIALIIMTMIGGCGGLRRDALILPRDQPVMINEVAGTQVRVSAYDKKTNALVEYGWIDGRDLVGKTIADFDWAAFIKARE